MGQISVFQFIEGITDETFESDNEYRIGTIDYLPAKNAQTVRIVWMSTDRFEYVKVDMLRKVDKDLYVLDIVWSGLETGHLPHHVQRLHERASRAIPVSRA